MNEALNLVGKILDLPSVESGHFIENSEKKIVFGGDRFWDDYIMRCFVLHPGAGSDAHEHPWCHWAVMQQGKGVFNIDGVDYPVEAGSYIHVPEGITHNFWNTSETEDLVLLCIVPTIGDVNPMMRGC